MRVKKIVMMLFCISSVTAQQELIDFCEQNANAFIALIWPIAQGKHEEIKNVLKKYGTIEYETQKLLSAQHAFTILKKAHHNGPVSVTSNFKAHLKWYFPDKKLYKTAARIFVCTFPSVQQATRCKYAIRSLFNLSYRSVHINDTHDEAIELAHLLCD